MIDGARLFELSTLTAYLGLLMWIGIRAARQVKTSLDYTVAGRDVAWIVVLSHHRRHHGGRRCLHRISR